MPNKDRSNKPCDFPIFLPLESSEIKRTIEETVPKLLQNIVQILGIENQPKICVDYETMFEIVSRVEKRRVYFHIFYDGTQMGELNEGALICFWILKLMPFKHSTIANSTLNAKIAYSFLLNLLFYIASKTGKRVNVKKAVMEQILYAFKYRDLSKEAIMALAESLLY